MGKKDKPVSYSVTYPSTVLSSTVYTAGGAHVVAGGGGAATYPSTVTTTSSTIAADSLPKSGLYWSAYVDDTETAPHAGEICTELLREYKADLALELELAWHDGITLEDVLELLEGDVDDKQ